MAYHLLQRGERERILCKGCGSDNLELRHGSQHDPRFVSAQSYCRSCQQVNRYTWTAPAEIVQP